jgi:hypothetical protein
MRVAPRCFKKLKGMQSLRRLDIMLYELDPGTQHRQAATRNVASDPLKLPGLRILESLRIHEVNIHGKCPTYRARLAKIVKVDADEETKKPARERKAKDAPPNAGKKPK